MKRDRTSLLALLAAAVILGSVGIKSYFDYRLAVETKAAPASGTAVADPTGGEPAAASPTAPAASPSAAEQAAVDQLPRSVLPPIPPEILKAKAPETPAPGTSGPAAPNPAGAGEKRQMQAEIDTLRRETELYQEKLDQLRSGRPTAAPPSSTPGGPPPASAALDPARPPATPNSALQAAMAPQPALLAPEPGTSPISPPQVPVVGPVDPAAASEPAPSAAGGLPAGASDAEVAALADQVKRQPAIAQVLEYDPDFAFLIINGGANRNIKPEMRLAVRRGSEILGFIKVVEVDGDQAIAELMSKNKFSPTARKPQPGDDIIAFNLF